MRCSTAGRTQEAHQAGAGAKGACPAEALSAAASTCSVGARHCAAAAAAAGQGSTAVGNSSRTQKFTQAAMVQEPLHGQ